MKQVIGQLDRTITSARRLLVARRVSMTLCVIVASVLLLAVFDWFARMGSGFRMVALVCLSISSLLMVVLWIIPSIRFNPSRRAIALRLEQSVPELRGRLASGVDFESSGIARANELAAASVSETSRRMRRVSPASLIDTRPAIKSMLACSIPILLVGFLFIAQPTASSIGSRRVLAPWTDAKWPPRTSVVSRMDSIVPNHGVHGKNIPLVLRAENLTPGDEDGIIEADYRLTDDGAVSDWNTVLLTHQRDGIHERVVLVDSDLIEITFRTSDAQTPIDRFRLLDVPEIETIGLTVRPPSHARPWIVDRIIQPENRSGGIEVIQNPVMRGSNLALDIELNRSIDVPSEPESRRDWLNTTLGINHNTSHLQLEIDERSPDSWRIEWTADQTDRMLITLTDEFGLQSDVAVPIHIVVKPDPTPDVVLLQPERDLDVLPTAIIPLGVKAVDDLPLRSLGIEISRESDQIVESDIREDDIEDGRFETVLDLKRSGAVEGDVLQVNGLAVDQWTDETGATRETRSRSRTIRVVTEPEFLSQMRNEMSLIEQRSIDLDTRQSEIRESFRDLVDSMQSNGTSFDGTGSNPVTEEDLDSIQSLEKQQSDMTRLMNEQVESTRTIREWIESNGLSDETMETVLDQVSESLRDGVESSSQALRSMESLGSSESGIDDGSIEEESRTASDVMENQSDVQEALQDVVRALSEDQESWLITRQLDRIRSDQQILQSETRRLSRDLNGRDVSEADPQLQSSIQDAARRQQSILSDLSDLTEEMQDQVQAMADVDPDAAGTLMDVMEEARQSDIESAMSDASDQMQGGRMQMADASQQEALDALDRMKESMTPDMKDRITDLLRRLSDLEESIRMLVEIQTNELELLERSIVDSNFDSRDDAMIDLRNRTISTSSGISQRTPEEKTIATRLVKASEAQGNAVGLLRTSPINPDEVRLQEELSLQQLVEAIQDVADLQARGEEEMTEVERVELARLYRELSESQLDIRVRTGDILDSDRSTRRTRHESRRLGLEQTKLVERSEELRSDNVEMEERPIFILMHDRISRISRQVSDQLRQSTADESTLSDQGGLARDYMSMAEALESETLDDEEFERRMSTSQGGQQGGQQGGSSQGSGQDQILPPIAELRLLRSLQLEIMQSTRLMDGDSIKDAKQREDEFRRLSELQSKLADLGQEMFDRHTNESVPVDMSSETPPPPSAWFEDDAMESIGNPPSPKESDELKSLDELLGLDVQSSSVDPTPLPANHDPLEAIVVEMQRASILIGQDLNPGPSTQRLQQDIIRRIDSLIDQAQQQQSSQQQSSQSSSQQSSSQNQGQEQEQGQEQQQAGQREPGSENQSNPQPGPEGDGSEPGSMDSMDARLGGALDETDREWGTLPARIRELLQQGRKDTYSNVYEKLTGEYYRRIAEQEGGS